MTHTTQTLHTHTHTRASAIGNNLYVISTTYELYSRSPRVEIVFINIKYNPPPPGTPVRKLFFRP